MYSFLNTFCELVFSLKKYPKKENDIMVMIKDTLNGGFNKKIVCDKVFISDGTDVTTNPINIVPIMPTTDILNVNTISHYDLEINKSVIESEYNPNEIISWLLHEICENVLSDNTLTRFKKILIKYYDTNDSGIKSVFKIIGYLTWIGIFSRTKKCFIENTSADIYSSFLKNNEELSQYIDSWNSALKKYISLNGGDSKILTDSYIENKDKGEFLSLNKLGRKYSSYAIKYNDTDYCRFSKYLIASEQSELLKYYIKNEPKHLAIFREKEIFNIFNDNKILFESTETELVEGNKIRSFVKDYLELELDVNNIVSTSDKIKTAVKLKDFQLLLTKAIEKDTLNNEVLQSLREKTNRLVIKLNNKKTIPAMMEEFI